ncbi:MAG: hypothetical protein V1834_01425 [Candidatus Micrarchaeota archaeon]
MKKTALFLILVLPCLLSAISSSEAREKAADFVANDPEIYASSKVLFVEYRGYWTFFYPLDSAKKTVIAIDSEDGSIVENEALLSSIASAIYDFRIIQQDFKQNQLGLEIVYPTVVQAEQLSAKNENDLATLDAQMRIAHPDFPLSGLEQSLSSLNSKLVNLEARFSDARSFETLTENTMQDSDIHSLLMQYNSTFGSLYAFLLAFEEFKDKVQEKQNELAVSGIPDPDNTNIFKTLENLKSLGLTDLHPIKIKNQLEFVQMRLQSKDTWVQDSVSSFLFEKVSFDANELYNKLLPDVSAATQSQSAIERCGGSSEFKQFQEKWNEVEYLRNAKKKETYKNMLLRLQEAQALLVSMKSKVDNCAVGPTVKPPTQEIDLSWIIILIAVAALGYAALQYKKQKDAENGQQGDYY